MDRTQFTFYASFYKAISRIKDDAARAKAYDAICQYALYGTEEDIDSLPDMAAIAYELIKPNLDASRKKAENGKLGGKNKQSKSKTEANGKQEQKANKKEKEKENKKENEIEEENEIEKESYISTPRKRDTPAKESFGQYGWVKLTEEEHNRLIEEYGLPEVQRAISYIDESAQSTGNKNKWKDWNLVVRKCIRDGWGKRQQQQQSTGGSFKDVFGDW